MVSNDGIPRKKLELNIARFGQGDRLYKICSYLVHPCSVYSSQGPSDDSGELFGADLAFSVYAFQDRDFPILTLKGPFRELGHTYGNKTKSHIFRKEDGSNLWVTTRENQLPVIGVDPNNRDRFYVSLKCLNFREVRISPLEL